MQPYSSMSTRFLVRARSLSSPQPIWAANSTTVDTETVTPIWVSDSPTEER